MPRFIDKHLGVKLMLYDEEKKKRFTKRMINVIKRWEHGWLVPYYSPAHVYSIMVFRVIEDNP